MRLIMFRRAIIQALEDRYNAKISEAEATIKIYMEEPCDRDWET